MIPDFITCGFSRDINLRWHSPRYLCDDSVHNQVLKHPAQLVRPTLTGSPWP